MTRRTFGTSELDLEWRSASRCTYTMRRFWIFVAVFLVASVGEASARWVRVGSGTSNALSSIHFASDQEGWIVGENVTILRSRDGGKSWPKYTQLTAEPAQCCLAVRFVTPTIGWIGGARTVTKVTSGSPYKITYNVQTEIRYDLFSASTDVAWVAGAVEQTSGGTQRRLWRIHPGTIPSQFTMIFIGSSGSYRSISFIDPNNGIAVGSGGLITRLTNAMSSSPGTSTQTSGTTADLYGVFMLDATNAWAVGSAGTILRYDGTRWAPQFAGTTNRLNDVSFKDANNGLIVGNAGIILSTTNGGATWTIEPSGVPDDLRGVDYGAGGAWAVGANGTILQRVVSPPRRRAARR